MKKYLQAPRTKALNSILSLFLLLLLASCATYESHNTIICSDPAAGPSANPSNTASCSKPSTTPTTHMWQYLHVAILTRGNMHMRQYSPVAIRT